MSAGRLLILCFSRAGYNVLGYPEYPSLIRGGHNAVQVKVSEGEVRAPEPKHDMLIALNQDAITFHLPDLKEEGVVVYDEHLKCDKGYGVPFSKIAMEEGDVQMKNTVALGSALALVNYPFEIFENVLRDHFGGRKGEEVAERNIRAARRGYEYVKEKGWKHREIKPLSDKRKVIITGNQSIALGAIKAGMKFYAAYPMTPASSILHYLAKVERDFDIIVKQTEDEIAAINYALGASFAGVRSMVGTSGGGFSLMVETLGLAGLSETPLVVVVAQRVGPSTGMPTWTEQGDLRFVLHASQGEFPRAVLAPGDVKEAFLLSAEAHNIAEKYQMPVILLTDKFLSESVFSTEAFKEEVKLERGEVVRETAPQEGRWKRYAITESGISPRIFPGTPHGMHVATSYEHDESGFSSESFVMRVKQVDKRARKVEKLLEETPGPKVYGEGEIALITWGSTKLPSLEALEILKEKGKSAKVIHNTHIYPFNKKAFLEALGDATPIVVENNSTAQFAGYLREQCLIAPKAILRYDGRPFFAENIAEGVERIMKGEEIAVVKEQRDVEYYYPYRFR